MIARLQMRLYIALHLQLFFIPWGRPIYGFTDMYLQQNTYISVLRTTPNRNNFVC